MSIRHLASGSACPPLAKGVLRVYNMRYCPYAERTLLVLHAKNIEHEVVNVNLRHKPEWLKEKNPLEKVPALEYGQRVLPESIQTCDFLEDTYPNPPLYPKENWAKYSEKALIDYFDAKVVSPFLRLLFRFNDPSKFVGHLSDLKNGYQIVESKLAIKGTKYFGGDKPNMVDYMIWPWFERVPVLESFIQEELFTSPLLKNYMENMKQDKAVKAVIVPDEDHKQYITSVISGEFLYDFPQQNHKL